jgi:hypothetical protein
MNKILAGVADARFYNSSGTLVFQGKTLIDDSITATTNKTEVRGGKGNQLLATYYHTAGVAFKITDAQWNLNMLAAAVGTSVSSNTSVYAEETVAVTSGAGSVLGTPLTVQGGLYGWVQLPDLNSAGATITTTNEKVTFTNTRDFTLGVNSTYTGNVCVRYYATNAAATYINIPANITPAIGRLVLDAQLITGNASSTSVIGKAEFIVPSFQLSGAFAISMTAGGVSTTPIDGIAQADNSLSTGACTDVPTYCKVIEILDSVNWYDNVYALAISGGDFALTAAGSPHTISVLALTPNSAPFIPPVADLTFSSDTTAKATVGTNTGVVTWVASGGTSLLHVHITSKATVEDSATVTCN